MRKFLYLVLCLSFFIFSCKKDELVSFTINEINDTIIDENISYNSIEPIIIGNPIGVVTYSLEGTDSEIFNINSSTGVVSINTLNYESPQDENKDNIYELSIRATDSEGNYDIEDWTLTVNNLVEWVNILENEDVYAITEDSQGKIWFGGYFFGIAILDGSNWAYLNTVDGLYSDVVRSLYKDSEDKIWIGTQEGLNYYENGAINKIQTNLVGSSVSSITQDLDNDLWFATYSGIERFNGLNWNHFDELNGINDDFIEEVATDQNGIVWIATINGISSYDGNTWTNYVGLYDFSANELDDEYIPSLMIDSDNNLWAITWGGGVLKYDGMNWSQITMDDGLSSNFGRAILEDDNGNILVGTTAGVSTYNGEFWTNEWLGSQIRCLFKDSEGTIWAGTKENGAFKYSNK